MDSIKDRVAIVGMGCVKFGENWGKSLEDMIVEAAYEAFEDAGVEPKDIEAAWWGSVFAGESSSIMTAPLKLGYIPATHVENQCATGSEAEYGKIDETLNPAALSVMSTWIVAHTRR